MRSAIGNRHVNQVPKLYLIDGGEPVPYTFTQQVITIGRSPRSLMRLDSDTVSSNHAEIHVYADGFVLHDLGSTNGTWVNGERISSCLIQDGDFICPGGELNLQFCIETHVGSTASNEHAEMALAR